MRSAKVSADNPSVALRAPAPVVPKAWPPPTKRRWRLGRRSRCPKFFARIRSQNFDRCHSFLLASSATGGARKRPPLHKGAFRTGDADCRVASLLAMTVLNLCHSEEAQRADVGIRPFYDGRGFGPPRSSAPTEGLPKSQQRADVPKAWLPPTKFHAEIWEPGASLSRDAELGQDGFLVGAHEGFLGALVQVVIA